MTPAAARVMFGLTLILLTATLGYLFLSSRPTPGQREVVAEFEDAFPLVEGMNVRVDGAVAGSVGKIAVDDDGLAEVTLRLDEDVAPVRADATAAIRQQDTTGDSYVAFDPGSARRPLRKADGRPTIACAVAERRAGDVRPRCPRTLVAPRLDDLLNVFGPSERVGIQLLLAELAAAVDQRGADLNRAALDLRPGLQAANRALADVNRQNAALRDFIGDAEAVSGQAASRSRSLARAIDGLARTLDATAAETAALDAGLRRLPATAARTRSTLAALTRAADAGRPLAEDLRDTAPLLATTLRRAPAFLDDTRAFATRTQPTLAATRDLLKDATPAIEAEPERLVTGPFDLAPAISNLLRGVLGENETIEVLFNEKFGLGAAANEPGNQPGYPSDHADRRFLRVSAILNCEGFGVPVRPGCLGDLLSAARKGDQVTPRRARSRERRRSEPASRATQTPTPTPTPTAAATAAPSATPRPLLPDLKLPLPVPTQPGQSPSPNLVEDLLDFLLD